MRNLRKTARRTQGIVCQTRPILSKSISPKEFWRMLIITGASLLFTFLLHVIVPSSYPRPEIDDVVAETNWAKYLVKNYLYTMDLPNNTFPSSHVVTVTVIWLLMASKSDWWPYRFYAIWGLGIVLSTLTVKQHYFLDVVVAILISVAVNLFAKKYWPEEK